MMIPAGTSVMDVLRMTGMELTIRMPTPHESLLHGLRELLEERRWEAEKQRLIEAGMWWGDE